MKKAAVVLIIFAFAVSAVFAGTTFSSVGSPKEGAASEVNVSFAYDPDIMQRLTFGFTKENLLSWDSDNGNLNSSGLNLSSQVMPGVGEKARGKGEVNFYWVLRTNKAVTAKLYLDAPMKEQSSNQQLDWYLKFDSNINDIVNHDVVLAYAYGIDSAVPIYSRSESDKMNVLVGYLPVQVFTDYTPVKMEEQKFTGTVGVVVETN